jgi:raffinose synthase
MSDTALARSSDDFWPRDPASHTTHVAVNALNSLFMSPLVQPDWDMFHSQHPAALLHASARVVSHGHPQGRACVHMMTLCLHLVQWQTVHEL